MSSHEEAHGNNLEDHFHCVDVKEDEYFGDIFTDERVLLEEIDSEDFLTTTSSANEDLWDVLEISNDDWLESQPDGFLCRNSFG